jgi:hypothetical protein
LAFSDAHLFVICALFHLLVRQKFNPSVGEL